MANAIPLPPPGFDDLDVSDQVEYVQALWDRIAANEVAVPVPSWHREVLDERLADIEANPAAARPWEDVKADLLRTNRGKR
jgi:putative addiction module component (TIGR02574 family)